MTNYAYVDGSYNPKTNVYGGGGFVVDQYGKRHKIKASGCNTETAKMRNVAGEILAAKAAMKLAKKLGMDRLTIFHDYEGIAKWVTGEWDCKKSETRKYSKFVNELIANGLIILFEHVKAHSGNQENEEADRLAKEAVGL